MTLCFIAFAMAEVCVCARGCFTKTLGAVSGVSQTETGGPKHVFFITVTIRLQSRDIQVTDSDTNLCTQVFTVTPSETARVSKGQSATKSVYLTGQWGYIDVDGVYWFLLRPCMCLILDGTTGNRIITNGLRNVIKECFRQSAFLLINIYIYFNFQQYRTHQTLDSITHRFHLLQ